MASKRVAVVTGGNKGIGLEVCRQLAKEVVVVLTARDEKRGAGAVAKLHSSGLPDVVFHQLDVTDQTVNNAGIVSTLFDVKKKVATQTFEGVQKCLETNYYGAKNVTQALLSLLLKSTSPRIINISSRYGQLHRVEDESARKILGDFDGLTEEVVDEVVNEYLQDAKGDELLEKKRWSSNVSGYIVSKAALNAYTRILAKKFPCISANAVSPGFVATEMTHFKGTSSVEEGARGPVRLALIPDGGPSGQYFSMTEKSTF